MKRGFRARTRPGQTLIEVTMGAIIMAITTVAMFSIILSVTVSGKKSNKKELSAMLVKEAQQTLQLFVTADYTNPRAPGLYYAPNLGARWTADSSGGWALAGSAAGVLHDISSLMNTTEMAELRGPAGANCFSGSAVCHLTYTVFDSDCGFGASAPGLNACKRVVFNIRFAD